MISYKQVNWILGERQSHNYDILYIFYYLINESKIITYFGSNLIELFYLLLFIVLYLKYIISTFLVS